MKRCSPLSIIGLLLFAIALYLTAVGSLFLIVWCLFVSFGLSLISLILFVICLYRSLRRGNTSTDQKISSYMILFLLLLLGYSGVVVFPFAMQIIV